jgi:hypothetical protein
LTRISCDDGRRNRGAASDLGKRLHRQLPRRGRRFGTDDDVATLWRETDHVDLDDPRAIRE